MTDSTPPTTLLSVRDLAVEFQVARYGVAVEGKTAAGKSARS